MAPPTTVASSVTSSVGVAPHHVTEDTPPDHFEGCMDLLVWLPNQKRIPVSVERKMPLMDLLVHVTTSNKISPGSHVLQLTDANGTQLPYKPSTPIGSLNAHNVYVIPKNRLSDKFSGAQQQVQQQQQPPFEATCRVQVRLPRNQLSVIRVSPRALLSEVLGRVCQERNLDPNRYELRHPVNLDERLRLSCTLSDYRLQEVVLAVSGHGSAGALSVTDLPAMKKNGSAAPASSTKKAAATSAHHGEKKRSKGFLGFMFGRKRSSVGDSSVSSESAGDRSLSPSHSDDGPPSAGLSPPSPVLVSKKVVGDQAAAAKPNSKTIAPNNGNVEFPAREITLSASTVGQDFHSHGSAELKQAARQKKRPAPLPPAFGPGHQVAESVISSCSSSSESTAVSLPPSVVAQSPIGSDGASDVSSGYHESNSFRKFAEPPVIARAKKLDQQSPRSQSVMNLASGAPKSAANIKNGRSSMSNLTQVNSTSESSITAALKKRKAPAPPPLPPPAQVAAAAAPPALAVEEDQVLQDASPKTDNDTDDSYEEVDFSPVMTAAAPATRSRPDVPVADDPPKIKAGAEPVYAVVVKKSKAQSPTGSDEFQQKPSAPTVSPVSDSPIMWEYKLPEPPTLPGIRPCGLGKQSDDSESETESRPSPLEKPLEADEDKSNPLEQSEIIDKEEMDLLSCNTVSLHVASSAAVPPLPETPAEHFEDIAPLQMSTPRIAGPPELEMEQVGGVETIPESSKSPNIRADSAEDGTPISTGGEKPLHPSGSLDVEDTPTDLTMPTDDSSGVFSDDIQSSSTSLEKETDEHEAEVSPSVIPVDPAAFTLPSVVSLEKDFVGGTLEAQTPVVTEDVPAEPLRILVAEDIAEGSSVEVVQLGSFISETTVKIPDEEQISVDVDLSSALPEETRQSGGAAVTLTSGNELQQESVTEEEPAAAEEPPKLTLREDPGVQRFGVESSTDEAILLAVVAEPAAEAIEKTPEPQPVELRPSPPQSAAIVAEIQPKTEMKTERQRPDLMRFSISSYSQRIELDGVTYEKKLSRAESFNVGAKPKPVAVEPPPVIKEVESSGAKAEAPAKKTESFVTQKNLVFQTADLKTPLSVALTTCTKEIQGTEKTGEQKASPADPVLNFIDQAKALLVSAPDSRAKMLEEELLKLQQQFIAWQQQQQQEASRQDKDAGIQAAEPAQKSTHVEENPDPVEKAVEEPDMMRNGSPDDLEQVDIHHQVEESHPQQLVPVREEEMVPTPERYNPPPKEPPHVIPDTWKPAGVELGKKDGSSRDPDFQPVEEEIRPQQLVPVREEEADRSLDRNEPPQKELRSNGPLQVTLDTWKPGRPKPEVIDLSREPCFVVPDLRSALLLSSSVSAERNAKKPDPESEPPLKEVPVPSSSVTRPSLLTRKASIDAPRPFQLHTNPMIKRPSFQFTKPLTSRAPEVRGFAQIPTVSSPSTAPIPPAADAPHESTPVQRLREQLIASARKPSAETSLKFDELKRDSSAAILNPLEHPIPMPVSSSLLLAATKQIEGPPAPPLPLPPPAAAAVVPQLHAQGAPQKRETVKARTVMVVDPREELLASIKNFSSGTGLKKVRGFLESRQKETRGQ